MTGDDYNDDVVAAIVSDKKKNDDVVIFKVLGCKLYHMLWKKLCDVRKEATS